MHSEIFRDRFSTAEKREVFSDRGDPGHHGHWFCAATRRSLASLERHLISLVILGEQKHTHTLMAGRTHRQLSKRPFAQGERNSGATGVLGLGRLLEPAN